MLISCKNALKIQSGQESRIYRGFIPAVTEEELRTFANAVNSLQVYGISELKKIENEIYDIGGTLLE